MLIVRCGASQFLVQQFWCHNDASQVTRKAWNLSLRDVKILLWYSSAFSLPTRDDGQACDNKTILSLIRPVARLFNFGRVILCQLYKPLLPVSLQQPPSKQADNEIPKTQTGKEKKEESVDTIQSMAVREKLKELETEIDKFRTENAALAKMRTEREEVRH